MPSKRVKSELRNTGFIAAFLLSSVGMLAPSSLPFGSSLYVYAQTSSKVRNLPCDFVQEEGCPVSPGNLRCDIDLDPFEAPMSSRIYFDYKNSSSKPVSAVKFRVRFVDGENKDRGTFHAVDSFYLMPGGDRSQKWKRDFTLHPEVSGLKIRVLQVKYADGETWESSKMQELVGGKPAAE